MKKKNLKSLKLRKKTISKLKLEVVKGGGATFAGSTCYNAQCTKREDDDEEVE